jgi:hypothetical protein
MLIHLLAHLDLTRDRERDLIARAERDRLAQASSGQTASRFPRLMLSRTQRRDGRVAGNATQNAASRSATFRELAYRVNGGVEVTLLWNVLENRLAVTVSDPRSGETLVIDTEHSHALDVFYHPYAHAAFSTAA